MMTTETQTSRYKMLARRTLIARWTALVGYFGLLIVLLNWFTWLSPPTQFPRAFLLIVLVVPLLFPLRGLLHGRTYTHSWTSFLSLLYFAIGIDVAFNNLPDRLLALSVVLFSLLLFIGCVFYAYYEKRRAHNASSAD